MNEKVERWLELLIIANAPGTYVIDAFARNGEHAYYGIIYQDGCIVINGQKWKPFDLEERKDKAYLKGKWIYNNGTEDESMIIGFNMNENKIVTSVEEFECLGLGDEWSNEIGCVSLLHTARFEDDSICGWYQGEWKPCKPKRLTLEELEQLARNAFN